MRSHSNLRDTQSNSSKESTTKQSGLNRASDELLLGNTTGFASTPENIDIQESLTKTFDNNESRYALQKIAQRYHPNNRVCSCMKTVAPTQNAIKVVYDDDKRHAHYRNLMRCDSVWLCPVCSGRISARRAEEIRVAYSYAVDSLGYRVVMATYTMQHGKYHSLSESVDAMREARRKMRSGRDWQRFTAQWGYVGCISSLELTWSSKSGWHVHVHELIFLDPDQATMEHHPDDSKMQRWLTEELSPRWIRAVAKVGRSASYAHGLQIDTTDKYITEYIAKHGHLPESVSWDIASEIAQSNRKIAKDGLHPFQILELSDSDVLTEEQRALYKSLWYEYADAFHGKKQIFWTAGLKDILCVDVIEEDSDIEEDGEVVFLVAREMWSDIVYLDKRGELLNKTILWRADTDRINQYFADVHRQAYDKRKNNDHWERK